MKAIRYYRYGGPDVLELRDVDMPEVADDRVLVKVRAASVNPLDWHYMRGTPYFVRTGAGLSKPKANGLGAEMAGQVEAVGSNVTAFQPGDEVFGYCSGGLAEWVTVRQDAVVQTKPPNLTFEQAASVPVAAGTALQALRDKGRVEAGQRVLVNGAAGGVGTFAVQLARVFGADVTGVCSTGNVDMVRSLGADRVIDYTCEDFTGTGQRYDLMIDIAGTRTLREIRRILAPQGTLVVVGGPDKGRWLGPLTGVLKTLVVNPFVSQKMGFMLAQPKKDDLAELAKLLENGLVTPVIDRTYPLAEAAEAIRYLETGHAKAKVVITM